MRSVIFWCFRIAFRFADKLAYRSFSFHTSALASSSTMATANAKDKSSNLLSDTIYIFFHQNYSICSSGCQWYIALRRYDIRQSRMIYLLRKYDIIFVPLHTRSVYHLRSRYHTAGISSVPARERISLKKAQDCFQSWAFFWRGARDSNPWPFGS